MSQSLFMRFSRGTTRVPLLLVLFLVLAGFCLSSTRTAHAALGLNAGGGGAYVYDTTQPSVGWQAHLSAELTVKKHKSEFGIFCDNNVPLQFNNGIQSNWFFGWVARAF